MNQLPWIVANWKMNGTADQVTLAAKTWQQQELSCRLIFCPPVCWAHRVETVQPNFYLGGQTCYSEASGAYTGHVSASMLKELGCTHTLVGHSEQRASGQQSQNVQKALTQAQQNGLTPIWCVGHRQPPLPAFDINEECDYITQTLHQERPVGGIYMIAYEPISAIGTGKPLPPEHAAKIVRHIKTVCGDVSVLYGGSVSVDNIHAFLNVSDGVLIGSMSLNIDVMDILIRSL